MKPTTISCLAILILVASQPGQSQAFVQIGIKTGVAASHLRMVELDNVIPGRYPFSLRENTVSPIAAVVARNRSIDFMPIVLTLQYHRSGGALTTAIGVTTSASPESVAYYVDYHAEVGFHYLSLSLSAEPSIVLFGIELYATAAPTLSYLLLVDNFSPMWRGYKRTMLGYHVGGGFRIPWQNGSDVSVEIAYRDQFTPFYSGTTAYTTAVLSREYYTASWLATITLTL